MQSHHRLLHRIGWAVIAALALTPLLVDPRAQDDSYMNPKWAWLAAWGGMGLALLVARAAAGRPILVLLRPLWFALAAWFVLHWIAILWAPSRGLGIDRALRVSWIVAILFFASQWLRTRRALIGMARVWIGLGAATAAWVLYNDVFPDKLHVISNLADWRGFLLAGLGNTSHIGDLLALTLLPTLIFFGEVRKKRMVWLLGCVAFLLPAGLIVSYSVDSNLGLILGALVMATLVARGIGVRWFTRHRRRWTALAAAWIGLVVFFNVDLPMNPHRPGILKQGFSSERWAEGQTTREAIWARTWEMIRQRPLLGAGTGNFVFVFPATDSAYVRSRPDLSKWMGQYTNAAHNEFLQAWAEQGIAGLILFVAILALAWHGLFSELNRASRPELLTRAALAGLLVCWVSEAQMNFTLQHPVGILSLMTILLGVSIEMENRGKGNRGRIAAENAMPSLVNPYGPLEVSIVWESMRRPTAIGAALTLPDGVGRACGIALLVLGAGWMGWCARPVIAQREYKRAKLALDAGDGDRADAYYRSALAFAPGYQDIRSSYSDVLINLFGQPEAGLKELAIVRERLNSPELWLREAQALELMGKHDAAKASFQVYADRTGAPPAEGAMQTQK